MKYPPALRYLPVHLKVWKVGMEHMHPGTIYATTKQGSTDRLTIAQLAKKLGITRGHLVCVLEDLEYIGMAHRLVTDRTPYRELDPELQPTVTDEDIWLVFHEK